MSRFVKVFLIVIAALMMVAIAAGCSPPLTPDKQLNMTEGVALDEIKVMVFQPPN